MSAYEIEVIEPGEPTAIRALPVNDGVVH